MSLSIDEGIYYICKCISIYQHKRIASKDIAVFRLTFAKNVAGIWNFPTLTPETRSLATGNWDISVLRTGSLHSMALGNKTLPTQFLKNPLGHRSVVLALLRYWGALAPPG